MSRLTRPRWLVLFGLTVVAVVVFLLLGMWQLRRESESADRERLYAQRSSAPVASLDDLLAGDEDLSWRRVEATGRYRTQEETILYGRPSEGRPGSHVLTPLETERAVLLVDRGWVPLDMDEPPVAEAAPPADEVMVEGLLVPTGLRSAPEPAERTPRVSRVSQAIAGLGEDAVFHAYLVLRDQEPPARGLPEAVPPPEPTSGSPHLLYAIQWFAFAAIAVGGVTVLARKEYRRGDGRPE